MNNGKAGKEPINQETLLNDLFELTKTKGEEINNRYWLLTLDKVTLSAGKPHFLIISLPLALQTGRSFHLSSGLSVTWNEKVALTTLEAVLNHYKHPLGERSKKNGF